MDFDPGQFWTESRRAVLIKGLAAGETFAVLGDRLGCSRNQAAGEARRMNFGPAQVAPPAMTARGARLTNRRVAPEAERPEREKARRAAKRVERRTTATPPAPPTIKPDRLDGRTREGRAAKPVSVARPLVAPAVKTTGNAGGNASRDSGALTRHLAIAGNGTVFETAPPKAEGLKRWSSEATGEPARIMDAAFGPYSCRWPLNDPGPGRGDETLFCNGQAVDLDADKPRYCAMHRAIASDGKPARKPRAKPPERRFA